MSSKVESALAAYVRVLNLRAQDAHKDAVQAQQALARTRGQMERLQSLVNSSTLKNSERNVAFYANAAGFRSGLSEVVHQFRDTYGVQQLQAQQAQNAMQHASQRLESMQCVLNQRVAEAQGVLARQAQKGMDELAGQAWMRQRTALR